MVEAAVNPSHLDPRSQPTVERLSGLGRFTETENADGTLTFVLYPHNDQEHPTEILFRQETGEKSVVTYKNTLPSNSGVLTLTEKEGRGTIDIVGENPQGQPEHVTYDFVKQTVLDNKGNPKEIQTFYRQMEPGEQFLLPLDSMARNLLIISQTVDFLRIDKPYYSQGGLQTLASPPHKLGLTPPQGTPLTEAAPELNYIPSLDILPLWSDFVE